MVVLGAVFNWIYFLNFWKYFFPPSKSLGGYNVTSLWTSQQFLFRLKNGAKANDIHFALYLNKMASKKIARA